MMRLMFLAGIVTAYLLSIMLKRKKAKLATRSMQMTSEQLVVTMQTNKLTSKKSISNDLVFWVSGIIHTSPKTLTTKPILFGLWGKLSRMATYQRAISLFTGVPSVHLL